MGFLRKVFKYFIRFGRKSHYKDFEMFISDISIFKLMKEIIFVTGNDHKFREFQNKLKEFELKRENVDLTEIQGDSEEIIKHKAKEAFRILKKPCLVEDTSFGFRAWNYLPGPYAKDFHKKIGVENFYNLLKEDKFAKATTYIAYTKSEEEIIIVKGEVRGEIVKQRIDNGFNFDRIFVPEGYEKTFSEMTIEKKNEISQRGKAIDELKKVL